jgi:hypothetical protein
MITKTRCFHHEDRQAAARCFGCGNFFCRECVTEHEGRLSCAACLRRQTAGIAASGSWRQRTVLAAMLVGGLTGSWLLFYTAGWSLEQLTAPSPSAEAAGR